MYEKSIVSHPIHIERVSELDQQLAYVRESLSNHIDDHQICANIYKKLESRSYKNEEEFVRDLTENETAILNLVLRYEMDYARFEQDDNRVAQLNSIYEQLLL